MLCRTSFGKFFCGFLISSPRLATLDHPSYAHSEEIEFFPGMGDMHIKSIAIVLIILFTLYNILGVKEASVMANVTMIAKIVPMGIILIGAIIIGNQMPDLSPVPHFCA